VRRKLDIYTLVMPREGLEKRKELSIEEKRAQTDLTAH